MRHGRCHWAVASGKNTGNFGSRCSVRGEVDGGKGEGETRGQSRWSWSHGEHVSTGPSALLCLTEAEALRLSGSRWLARARGQLWQSWTVASGHWAGRHSLDILLQPQAGPPTVRAGGQASTQEADPSLSPWEPHSAIQGPSEAFWNVVEWMSKLCCPGAQLLPSHTCHVVH